MTSRKGLNDVWKYNGKPMDYGDWKAVLIGFFRSEDLIFRKFLEHIENLEGGEVKLEDLYEFAGDKKDDPGTRSKIEWYDNQLYSVLMLKTKDDALALVKSVPEESPTKGARAWMKVTRDQEGMNALRMTGLARRVMQPDKVRQYQDIVAAVEQWELRVKEFQKVNNGFKLPDSMMVNGLCHVVPAELEREIMKLPNQEYTVVKRYVYDQVAARKEPWFHGERKGSGGAKDYGKNHQGVADMELDMAEAINSLERLGQMFMTQDEGGHDHNEDEEEDKKEEMKEKLNTVLMALQGKGGKGGGKSGGKGGKFNGTCHHCGKHGHRISECWIKDEDVRRKNGGGKGGDGGAGGWNQGGKGHGGKGGYQGYQSGGWYQGGKSYGGKGGYQQGYQNYGHKGGKAGGGKGNLNWCEGGHHDHGGADGWQQAHGGHRQLFSLKSLPIPAPPGLTLKNRYGGLEGEDEEEEEFGLPEAMAGWEEQPKPGHQMQENKRKAMKKVKHRDWRPLKHAMTLTAEPVEEPIQALSGVSWLHVDPETKWRRVRSVVDSGASDNCGPPELAPEVPVVESAGSRRGQRYAAAGGKSIENLGEKTVEMVTNAGQDIVGTWQMAEVVRPLNSVMRICQKGNRVWFEETGGAIENLYTGEVTTFGTEGDIYTLDLWLPPAEGVGAQGGPKGDEGAGLGFTGPGWKKR